ncbi:MAG: hypothetical protein D6679_05555 [Candidatus Hydrogenedentota bacterium]|nr:MAG: hypothetical protein D6679_05555 [Candidatus Hydrogenedentota bacterium]
MVISAFLGEFGFQPHPQPIGSKTRTQSILNERNYHDIILKLLELRAFFLLFPSSGFSMKTASPAIDAKRYVS